MQVKRREGKVAGIISARYYVVSFASTFASSRNGPCVSRLSSLVHVLKYNMYRLVPCSPWAAYKVAYVQYVRVWRLSVVPSLLPCSARIASKTKRTAAMSVSLLSRRVAGLSLRSAGAGACSPVAAAATAVSSLSTIAGSGASAATTLVSASPATAAASAAAAASCGGYAGSHQQVQQVRFMSKKSKRSGGDDLVSLF